MSKDFEKEYIKLAQNEIPDLWARIEAGLVERSAPENAIDISEKKSKTKKNGVAFLKRYAGLAAAILCVILIVPASVYIRQSESKSSSEAAAAPEESWEETAAEGAYDTACEASYDTACETESAASEEETMNAASSTGAADREEARTILEDAGNDEMADETAIMESAEQKEDLMSGKEEKKAEDGIIRNVIVQVSEEKSSTYQDEKSASKGTLYTVMICRDASGTFAEGEQIEIYLPEEFSFAMPVGEEVEIDIACDNDGECLYRVDQIHLQKE